MQRRASAGWRVPLRGFEPARARSTPRDRGSRARSLTGASQRRYRCGGRANEPNPTLRASAARRSDLYRDALPGVRDGRAREFGLRGLVVCGLVVFWHCALAASTRRSRRKCHQDDIQADRRAPETPAVAAHRAAWRQRRRRAPAARRPRAGARPSRPSTTPPGPPSWPRPSLRVRRGGASSHRRRRWPSRPRRPSPTAFSRPRRGRHTLRRRTTSYRIPGSGSRRSSRGMWVDEGRAARLTRRIALLML